MRESKNYYKDILLSDSRQKTIDNACIQRMQPGYHFGPHMHSTVEMFVCVEGRCVMTVCQTRVEIEKEDYIVILQNHPHSCDVMEQEECVILQIHFHPDVFMDLFSDSLRDNQLYFLLDLTIGTEKFYPGQMFTYFRINKAIELMSDENAEYSLTQLALEVGFGSLQHFSKVFKNTMNISPTKYFSHLPGKGTKKQ